MLSSPNTCSVVKNKRRGNEGKEYVSTWAKDVVSLLYWWQLKKMQPWRPRLLQVHDATVVHVATTVDSHLSPPTLTQAEGIVMYEEEDMVW